MNWNIWRVGAVLALLVGGLAPPARAQNWPTRAVKFIVPFGPGAGADIGARVLQIPVSTADKARIAHGNAERLFRL